MLIKINKKIINTLIANSLLFGGFVGSLSQLNASEEISDVNIEDYNAHYNFDSSYNWLENLPTPEDELRGLLNVPSDKINWGKVREMIRENPKLLTVQNSKKKQTALHLAVQEGDLDVVKALITQLPKDDMKDCLKVQDKRGRTPLHLAVKSKNLEMVKALIAQLPEADMKDYLKVQDKYGQTLLHLAVQPKNLEMVKALMTKLPKADMEACLKIQDNHGRIPLHLAISRRCGIETIQALTSKFWRIEVYRSESTGKILKKFMYWSKSARHIIEYRSQDLGQTMLHLAVLSGRRNAVYHILECAKNLMSHERFIDYINAQDKNKQTALDLSEFLPTRIIKKIKNKDKEIPTKIDNPNKTGIRSGIKLALKEEQNRLDDIWPEIIKENNATKELYKLYLQGKSIDDL
ncbi:MAG: ankyrin repeat domain-containing protein [Puniceicoccales bacterium]|jgi:ankyrin repeat protein|nr:ankyrin repeat domain-containing protein [Puniceicoccales bacterium]